MEGPKIHFNFEPSEYMALCVLAKKYNTDLGSILRIGGQMVLEADRRGFLKLHDPLATARAVSGEIQ